MTRFDEDNNFIYMESHYYLIITHNELCSSSWKWTDLMLYLCQLLLNWIC